MNLKEKATAPVSSVGADGKQPLVNSNKKSIAVSFRIYYNKGNQRTLKNP